jgi:hypothetical protein
MANPSLEQLIAEAEQWFADTMHNSVVSREVAVYNHVHAAFEDLKARITALITGKPAPVVQPVEAEEAADMSDKAAKAKTAD